jgi:hypothetical protein
LAQAVFKPYFRTHSFILFFKKKKGGPAAGSAVVASSGGFLKRSQQSNLGWGSKEKFIKEKPLLSLPRKKEISYSH